MKRRYSHSRSASRQRHKSHRDRKQHSRSREKQSKKSSRYNSSREKGFRISEAKVESDIKNHFKLQLPHLSTKEEEETIALLKTELVKQIGPVEHISRSRQNRVLNLGFKYDIDALSFLQTMTSQKIILQAKPTRPFEYFIRESEQKEQSHRRSPEKQRRKQSSRRSRSYSSSSSSKKSRRSKSKSREKLEKLQIFGIPSYMSDEKALGLLAHAPGGPYKFYKSSWKSVKDSVCQFLQVRLPIQKANKLIQLRNRLELDGRPIVIIQENSKLLKQLNYFEVQLRFPKPVHPSKVLKHLEPFARIVQIVATEEFEEDGKNRGYIVTFNDSVAASQLKRMGTTNSGIWVGEPKSTLLVYRPISLLPTRNYL